MTTINLKPKGVELAKAIRDERNRCFDQAQAIQKEAQEQLAALSLESQMRMKELWRQLLTVEGLNPEEYDRWMLDMNYLDEHGLGFLRFDASTQPAPSGSVNQFPLNAFVFPDGGGNTKH